MAGTTHALPPDPGGLITALRSIGYNLNAAIADLVDNSIDADATEVLVRFVHDKADILKVFCPTPAWLYNQKGATDPMTDSVSA